MTRSIFVFFVLIFFWSGVSFADQEADGSASDNYSKSEQKFLPGEEVVTPTGQRMKVWSTAGPVEVSKAPEPFEDSDETSLKDSHLVIDAEEVLKRNQGSR